MNSNKHEAAQIGRREFLSQFSAAVTGSTLALANARGQNLSAEKIQMYVRRYLSCDYYAVCYAYPHQG